MGFMSAEERALGAALSRLGMRTPSSPSASRPRVRRSGQRSCTPTACGACAPTARCRIRTSPGWPSGRRRSLRFFASASPPAPSRPHRIACRTRTSSSTSSDFYYRLCSDIITTPSLAEQLRESPDELPNLILFLARRLVGDEEADALADEVGAWIEEHVGPTYPLPGNVRELEQCVRNVLIRGEYRPPTVCDGHPEGQLAAALRAGELTADQLLARYCALVYAETRNYQETARHLGLDRRTVDQYKTEGK